MPTTGAAAAGRGPAGRSRSTRRGGPARDALSLEYLNLGFASAVVTPTLRSRRSARIDLVFKVEEGPQTIVDHILIVGNRRHEARRHPCASCSSAGPAARPRGVSVESQRRLSAARPVPARPHHRADARRRRTSATSSSRSRRRRRTTIGYGGGVEEMQVLPAVPSGTPRSTWSSRRAGSSRSAAGTWGARTDRSTSTPGVSLRPNDEPDDPNNVGHSASPSTASSAPTGNRARSAGTT